MFRGNQVDHPLSKKGWQQMHKAISRYYLETSSDNDSGWDLIVSSPLLRCHAFAEVLSQQLQLPLVTHDQLTEISFGEWEGKTPAQIQAIDPILFRDFHQDPVKNRPLGGEGLAEFSTRIMDALLQLLEQYRGKRILLVTHAGIMRTILVHVLSAPLKSRQSIRFPYAGMLRLIVKEDQMRLECF